MPLLARRILPLALVAALVLTALLVLRELRGGTGYAAKVLCSGVFVAGRTPESLLAEDLGWFSWLHPRVDRAERTASSDWHGLGRTTAVYRDGLGCALAVGASPDELRAQGFDPGPAPPGRAEIPWPVGDRVVPAAQDGAGRAALEAAVASAFGETDPQRRRRTRAVIVLHSGQLVAERYAPGFDATTPLLGWSMTKSVIATLIGMQVLRGRLDPAAGAPVASWRGDERAAITLEQLLRMTSGLAFSERNGALGDSVAMLFRSRSAAGYAAHSPLAHAPGTYWSYSSGTSNLLSGILRASLPDAAAYHRFPREALFDRIGMRSAVLETDAAGDFVGSSFSYATARDWARFGLLHAQDGVWEDERLLPAGWVAFVRRPTPQSPRGSYGAHWWLNAGEPGAPETRPFPSLPPDLFFASGYEGQFVVVIPSHDLVVVRLGQSEPERAFDLEAFLGQVIAAFPTQRG